MTLIEAFRAFLKSEEYREIAKQRNALGGKYRMYLLRFNRGELRAGAMVEVLIANGYEIIANKIVRKPKRKSQTA